MTRSIYIVQQGDSLWSIATNFGIRLSNLIAANPQIANPALIYPGQVINLPILPPIQPAPGQTRPPTTVTPPAPGQTRPPTTVTPPAPRDDFATQVVQLVNEQRVENGLQPLTINPTLMELALTKSQDMHDNNYFSHVSPTFGTPFEMLRAAGVSYSAAGENIARGQRSPSAVMTAWMNSPGHRANILSPNFTEIGVGFVDYGRPIWTQLFLRP